MTMRWVLLAGAAAAMLSGPASADQILTLGQVERVNWLLLTTDPLNPESGKQCALSGLKLPEDLGQVLQRLGFPKVVDVADDPDFLLPTFTFYAAAEPVAGAPARCAISAYATLEMPAPGAEFGFPRVVLWQTPMAVAAAETGGDQPGAMVRYTLQGMIEVMVLGFIGAWKTTRGE
ncbi:MAG: hypothetical protein C0484_26450 [Rhodospirillum sp.]|nr:hypothetical protein [Rhodospirillum sp.]